MWGTDQSVSLSEEGIKNLTNILAIQTYFWKWKKTFSKKKNYYQKNLDIGKLNNLISLINCIQR